MMFYQDVRKRAQIAFVRMVHVAVSDGWQVRSMDELIWLGNWRRYGDGVVDWKEVLEIHGLERGSLLENLVHWHKLGG